MPVVDGRERLAGPAPACGPAAGRRARWRGPVVVALSALVLVLVAAGATASVVGGAHASRRAGAAPALAATAAASNKGSAETGYLFVGRGTITVDAEFVTIQVSRGAVSGTASQAALDNGVVVTSTTRFTGTRSGTRVHLRLSELSAPWMFGAVIPDLSGRSPTAP